MLNRTRHLAVLSLIALLPFGSGLATLDPDHMMLLGLANLSFMIVPLAMLILWPELRTGLLPRGRLAVLTGLVMGFAVFLALVRAPHTVFSLTVLQFWVGALIAGRAMQLAIRADGPRLAEYALVMLLIAGPLYALLLPLMQMVYGGAGPLDWLNGMPGFNNIRKMSHLLTLSAVAGLGLVAFAPRDRLSWREICVMGLSVVALALVLWSGARGAWIASCMGMLIVSVVALRAGIGCRVMRVLALLPPAVMLALILPVPHRSLGFLEEIQYSAARTGDLNTLSSGRIEMWRNAVDLIGQSPISGYGWGQYIFLQDSHLSTHLHDFPLDLLLGLGVPMGLLAMGVMAALWIEAHRRALRAGQAAMAALCVLDTMAAYSLVSGTYFYGVPVVLTGLVWGICLTPQVNRTA